MNIIDLILSDAIWLKSQDFSEIMEKFSYGEYEIARHMIVCILNRASEFDIDPTELLTDSEKFFQIQNEK